MAIGNLPVWRGGVCSHALLCLDCCFIILHNIFFCFYFAHWRCEWFKRRLTFQTEVVFRSTLLQRTNRMGFGVATNELGY